jgi:hypothetical protein
MAESSKSQIIELRVSISASSTFETKMTALEKGMAVQVADGV